jgi:hypothetical protein
MVLEVRKIILSKGELAMALNSYRRVSPDYLPDGKVIGCDVPNEQQVAVDLEIEQAHMQRVAAEITRVLLDRPKLTEPLIHFCIDNHIMLPRKGKKSALLSQGMPALFVELESHAVVEFES